MIFLIILNNNFVTEDVEDIIQYFPGHITIGFFLLKYRE